MSATLGLSLFDDILPALGVDAPAQAAAVIETAVEAPVEAPAAVDTSAQGPTGEDDDSKTEDVQAIVSRELTLSEVEDAVAQIAVLEQLTVADPARDSSAAGLDFNVWFPDPAQLPAVVPPSDPGAHTATPVAGSQIIPATGTNTYGYQAALRVAERNRQTPTHEPTEFTLAEADRIEALSEATRTSKDRPREDD